VKEQLEQFSTELKVELKNILTYWQHHTIDHENGGFYGQIDHHNNVINNASKGAVLNTRILWTFSAAYNFTRNESYLETATRAFEYIKNHFLDREHGGLTWEVDHLGRSRNTRKQTYAQGFGVYGFSEYFKVSGKKESLQLAIRLFEDIESNCFDTHHGGYIEALTQDWQPMDDMRLSLKDQNYPKSMNTHLHILEAYTNLYKVWPDPHLAGRIELLMRIFLNHIIDQNRGHFNLFFDKDWTVKSEIISYGHDIEGTWLLSEAAEILGKKDLSERVKSIAIKMIEGTISEGMAEDGSLYYEKESISGGLDRDRHWWPQAEAVVGLLNAFQLTGNRKYLDAAMKSWAYIKSKIIDRKHGEWYWSVDDHGIPSVKNDKVGFWKCPYHNSRVCMEGVQRIKSIAQLWN